MVKFLWAWMLYTWGGLHRYFGNKNSMSREHAHAARYFARAYKVDPTFREARLQRAILLGRELGRLDEALAEFDALLADDAKYKAALLNRGLLLQGNGRFQEALVDIETYLQLPEPDSFQEEAIRIAALLREIINEG